VPSTPIALILFAWLTIPGLVYILQRRRMSQIRTESAFVESARIALVSVASDLIAIGILELVRLVHPSVTPDLRNLLIDNWREQLSKYWSLDMWWAIGLMAVACFVAYVIARWGEIIAPFFVGSSQNTPYNAWWKYFRQDADDKFVYVGLDLNDNRFVEGYVVWFSTEINDTADRDLVIQKPKMRFGTELQELECNYFIVSARDIKRIHLTYIESEPELTESITPTQRLTRSLKNLGKWQWFAVALVGITPTAFGIAGLFGSNGNFETWTCSSLVIEGAGLTFSLTLIWSKVEKGMRGQDERPPVKLGTVATLLGGLAWAVWGIIAFQSIHVMQSWIVEVDGSLAIILPASVYAINKASQFDGPIRIRRQLESRSQ